MDEELNTYKVYCILKKVVMMSEIIIVGAGPAGSVAAKKLSDLGFNVSLYEKERLPRHKHCGGLITNRSIRSLNSIGIDCSNVLSQRIFGWRFQFGNDVMDLEFETSNDNIIGNVYREDFDYFITKSAIESGAKVIDATKVIDIKIPENKKDNYFILTQKGKEECEIILGSDGMKSIVRRSLAIPYPRNKWAIAIEAEIPVNKKSIESFDEKNYISINYVQEGIVWAFPKMRGKTINAGLAVSLEEVRRKGKSLFDIWKKFLRDQKWYENQNVPHHVGVIPIKGTVEKLGFEKILLLGDAAGLVDPLRGEGISYAIESGIKAAEAVKLHLEGKSLLLPTYNNLMKDDLAEINIYGMKLHNEFYVKKKFLMFLKMAKKNEDIRSSMLRLSCGLSSNKQLIENFSLGKLLLTYIRSMF